MEEGYQTYLDLIKEVFPFRIMQVDLHDGGDDFLVFEINSEWMFRFPRNNVSRKTFEKETQFLARFKPLSPLSTPYYQYVGDGFAGYRKIQGRHLSDELFQGFAKSIREKIARQFGSFLSALHKFPLDEAAEIGLTPGWDGVHHKNGAAFLEQVAPLLSPCVRSKATRCIENLLAEEFTSRVIHGDFYLPDHVFYDESKRQLGVIDFADVTIYDPAHDFQCILEIGGETFFESVMKYYQGEMDDNLLKRSKLRLEARPLFYTGYIFTIGIEDQYASRIAFIEETFSNNR